jgi:hypothetical protein
MGFGPASLTPLLAYERENAEMSLVQTGTHRMYAQRPKLDICRTQETSQETLK